MLADPVRAKSTNLRVFFFSVVETRKERSLVLAPSVRRGVVDTSKGQQVRRREKKILIVIFTVGKRKALQEILRSFVGN